MHPAFFSFDTIAESAQLIALLQQHQARLPFVVEVLAHHQVLHKELVILHQVFEDTLQRRRDALTQRWHSEVAARRVYLQVQRALVQHFGAEAPALQLFVRGDESNSNAPELLADLRRLHTALIFAAAVPETATQLLPDIVCASTALADAIALAEQCDWQHRNALLNQQLGYQAFERSRSQTYKLLVQQLEPEVMHDMLELAPCA